MSGQPSKRSILHITAGEEDWQPSAEELTAITEMFMAASVDPLGAVITTRTGIAVKLIDVQEGVDVQVVRAHVDAETGAALNAADAIDKARE
jgi:hypothetical protein